MDKINRMKEEYNEIKAPQSMYKAMGELVAKRARRRMMISRAVRTAAMLVLVFAISLNMLPDTAKAMMDVPVLGGIVKIFTLGRYTSSGNGKEIDVVTPQLGGMIDGDMQKELNEKFRENAKVLIEAAENNTSQGFIGTYAGYEVKTDNENILAVDLYVENVEGSASVTHDFYTIDKKTGKVIEFHSLFKDGADYISPIDSYITAEMEKANAEEPDTFDMGENGFETIGKSPKFYISESGNIVICFDEYEVASGSAGSPEFEIPNEVVKDILK